MDTFNYLKQVNDSRFREANKLTHQANSLLLDMGLTKEEATEWIEAWMSGSGEGID